MARASGDLKSKVNRADAEVARLVVDNAQNRAGGEGRQAARAAASLRASRTAVTGGGSRLAWFAGAEFGALRYGQFKRWRGNQPSDAFSGGAGYFLFPSIRDSEREILQTFRDALMDAVGPAFKRER
jgi:hypothetical protein